MFESRRIFLKKALVTGGGLASLAYLVPHARASGCKAESRLLLGGWDYIDGISSHSFHTDNWKLGDCELKGLLISFQDQDNAGSFKAQVGTHFTHHKDVWHFRLELFTGDVNQTSRQTVLFDRSWDGPEMSELDKPLFHSWQFNFPISPAINLGKVYARASSCC